MCNIFVQKMGLGMFLRVGLLSRDCSMFVCVIALEFMPIYGEPKSAPLFSLIGQIVVVENVWSHSNWNLLSVGGPNAIYL